jgi:hypothetical protein
MNLEQAIKQSDNPRYDYPDIFKDDCGLDIVIADKKLHAVKSWTYRNANRKRRATLNITSFVGVSFNAIHYYGRIEIDGVEMEYNEKLGITTSANEDQYPLGAYKYRLELTRPLTKKELNDDPERWGDYYYEGDLTNCFETIENLISLAKEVFKLRFTGDWDFYVESPFGRFNGKLEINN